MERALDPELLQNALGDLPRLPTAEELARLLAESELRLLTGQDANIDELLPTAWSLHAVGTSEEALDRYGPARQRACFRVAAHIFDLALRSSRAPLEDRLCYCFAAQVGYLRSELNPNTAAIYRRFSFEVIEPTLLITQPSLVSLELATAFLGLQPRFVGAEAQRLLAQSASYAREWGLQSLQLTMFGAAVDVVTAVQELQNYLTYGEARDLERARGSLRSAVINPASVSDRISRWVAAHLLDLAVELDRTSLWTVLPLEIPNQVRTAFAMGSPPVLTLWPPQLELLKPPEPGMPTLMSPEVKRSLITTPTSGGKTLAAQLLVAAHLATQETSVCYVAPTRSLCREVLTSMRDRLRYLDVTIQGESPPWQVEEEEDERLRVEVMTPERLSYLLRIDSGRVLDTFGMFIFDEIHNVADRDRGWLLESDLAFLHHLTRETHHRIVLVSAVIGNAFHFVNWLASDGQQPRHYSSDWRGPRRIHSLWRVSHDRDAMQQQAFKSRSNYKYRQVAPLVGQLDVRLAQFGELFSFKWQEPVGKRVWKVSQTDRWERDSGQSTANYQTIVPLALHLRSLGPLLVIAPTKADVVRFSKAMARELDPERGLLTQALQDLVETTVGRDHPLYETLASGVPFHHSGLPREVREAIEDEVANGNVDIVIATTTLAEGVNLPVKSVLITAQGAHDKTGYKKYITGAKLVNAIGRAGRAGKETEGIVVLATTADPQAAFAELEPVDEILTARSRLASEDALGALAEFEERQAALADVLLVDTVKSVSDFLTFVWTVVADADRADRQLEAAELERLLGNTLAWTQLQPADRQRWLTVARTVVETYYRTPMVARRRWSTAGTSLNSAKRLENLLPELIEQAERRGFSENPPEAILEILTEERLAVILNLPEAPSVTVKTRSNRGALVNLSLRNLLSAWLRGTELKQIADDFLEEVENVEYRVEQLSNLVSSCLETFLPWVLGTLISWINEQLTDETLHLDPELPSYIRWGVPNKQAITLLNQGIRSRRLASQVVEIWRREITLHSLKPWLGNMTLATIRERFEPSEAELRNLLQAARHLRQSYAAHVLNGTKVNLQMLSRGQTLKDQSATLTYLYEGGRINSIGVVVNHEAVAEATARDYLDLAAVLDTTHNLRVVISSTILVANVSIELRR